MDTTTVLIQFQDSIITFLDELISLFPKDTDLIMFRIFLKDRIPIVVVMNIFIMKLLPLKNMIQKKDENFFLNECDLFDELQNKKEKIQKFKSIWRSNSIDNQNRQVIWKWFESFVYLAEKYQKFVSVIPQ